MVEAPPSHAQVLVVGAGPGGSVVTHTLATRGYQVVCLEQGDWVSPAEYPANFPEWELLIQHAWAHEPGVRKLPADYPLDCSDSDMSPIMYNAVGGGSLFYGAEWPRLVPSDFAVRTLDGVGDDWPIRYEDLAPFYDEVDRFIGVAGLEGDPGYPDGLEYPMPPHPLGKAGRKAAEGMNKLGWSWWPGSNAIPTSRFKELARCARWGVCEWGCPEGSKASFDLAYWPHSLRSGATLVTGARVRQVTTGPDGLATGALWVDRSGTEHRITADVVVVACNGIGTPRLLLMSAGGTHPDGLANSSGLVGRHLMLHPNCTVTGYYDEDLESWRGPAGQLIHSHQFYETDTSRGFVRGAKIHALPTPGPLSAVEVHRQLPFDELWGERFHAVARTHRNGLLWAANTEDLPEASNRVLLNPEVTDDDGLPAAKVEYRLSDNTRRILRWTVERMTEIHQASGAVETFPVELWIDQPGHLLGTARMGDDPGTSVVDSWGRAHDCPNLFLADGSIFVTGGSANPTATIAALALRVATGIDRSRRDQEVPA